MSRTMRVLTFTLAGAMAAVAPLPGPSGSVTAPGLPELAAQQEFRWSGRVDRGATVEVRGVNGRIHAERASGSEVQVEAVKRAKRSDPESVQIEVIEHAEGVTICAVYPSERGDRPNECLPGGGRMNVQKNDVTVHFTVRVPEGVNLVARTVNGEIRAREIGGDMDASTVNGSIDVSARGTVEASTVNGSIVASVGRADWNGELDFSTVNGSITLTLPEDLNARVSASTVNGNLSSDFPLTVEGRFSPRRLTGRIGDGGRDLSLKTVNGSITLRRT